MARADGLPPPSKGGKRKPDMAEEDPSIYGKLSSLAGGGGPEMEGRMPPGMAGGGMGGEGQAASLIQSGVSQLVQAAQMHPALQPIIAQVVDVLREGIGGIAGGEPGGGGAEMEGGAPTRSRRTGPPKTSPPKRERGGMMGVESGY